MDRRPEPLGAQEPVEKQRFRSTDPSNPNSRRGRRRPSPIKQGRDKVDAPIIGQIVGIDTSKDRLDVHLLPSGEAFAVAQDEAGRAELVARLVALAPKIVVIEATGGYERAAVMALAAAGVPVAVVNPRQVRAFAEALGQRAKSDAIDARVIALFAEGVKLEARELPDEAAMALADLVARHKQLVDMRQLAILILAMDFVLLRQPVLRKAIALYWRERYAPQALPANFLDA